jgi:hypothetical protein
MHARPPARTKQVSRYVRQVPGDELPVHVVQVRGRRHARDHGLFLAVALRQHELVLQRICRRPCMAQWQHVFSRVASRPLDQRVSGLVEALQQVGPAIHAAQEAVQNEETVLKVVRPLCLGQHDSRRCLHRQHGQHRRRNPRRRRCCGASAAGCETRRG